MLSNQLPQSTNTSPAYDISACLLKQEYLKLIKDPPTTQMSRSLYLFLTNFPLSLIIQLHFWPKFNDALKWKTPSLQLSSLQLQCTQVILTMCYSGRSKGFCPQNKNYLVVYVTSLIVMFLFYLSLYCKWIFMTTWKLSTKCSI